MSPQDLLTEVEAAPILRLKIKTLQQWRQLRRGPRFVRLGRRIFYPRSELDRFIANNLVDTVSERT
jgi:helix-turn-helix protein